MILDLVVNKTDDGCTAEIPSLKGCESWAHDEETVLEKIKELASFYLKTEKGKFKLDRAKTSQKQILYKLIFNKS
jgi:predicted RNase H-like HicB family nuclease